MGAGYGGTAHGQPPRGHWDVRSGCSQGQVRSAEHHLHYFPATKGQLLGASPIRCHPPTLLDDPMVPQQCQAARVRLRPRSCLETITCDRANQVFLVSRPTSHAFLKGIATSSCMQSSPLPGRHRRTQHACLMHQKQEGARTRGEGTEEEGKDAGEPRACLPAHPSKLSYALLWEGSAGALQSPWAKILTFSGLLPCFRGWRANGAPGNGGTGASTYALNVVQKGTSSCYLLETSLRILPITP